MPKIKNIEFLRTILLFSILMLHIFKCASWSFAPMFPDIRLYQVLQDAFARGNNGVEGFFIISGFLLLITFNKTSTVVNFIKKKYIRLSPPIAFAAILCIIGWFLHIMHFKLIPNVVTIFLLNQFGICWTVSSNPVLWFTSTLFTGLLTYFCVLKFVPEKYYKQVLILLIVLGYGILEFLQHGSFARPLKNYYFIFNIGFLRAIGGIGLGCLIGIFYKVNIDKIKTFVPTLEQKVFINILEIFLISFVIWWLMFTHSSINNIVFVIVFSILFIMLVLKKGFLSNFFDNDICSILGRYQYSIYVTHYPVFKILSAGFWKTHTEFVLCHPVVMVFITLLTIIFLGILTYHFVEVPCADYLTNKFLPKKIKS